MVIKSRSVILSRLLRKGEALTLVAARNSHALQPKGWATDQLMWVSSDSLTARDHGLRSSGESSCAASNPESAHLRGRYQIGDRPSTTPATRHVPGRRFPAT